MRRCREQETSDKSDGGEGRGEIERKRACKRDEEW